MSHNPCFSGNSFAILQNKEVIKMLHTVTILVLVETPLQSQYVKRTNEELKESQSLF